MDALTDKHPLYLELKTHFGASHRRYSGIVLDVLFDYFLSDDWSHFSDWDRGDFVEGTYCVLREHRELQPPGLAAVAPRWVAADWLRVYESLEGIDAVLHRIARRFRQPERLMDAWIAIRDDVEPLREGFHQVFGDVQRHIEGGIASA